jgi:hypothetical protein
MSQDPSRLIDAAVLTGNLTSLHKDKKFHDLNHWQLSGRELVMALLATTNLPRGDLRTDPNTCLIYSTAQRVLWQEAEIERLKHEIDVRSSEAWREKEPQFLDQNDKEQINHSWVRWFMKKYQENIAGAMKEAGARYAKETLGFAQNATHMVVINAVGYKAFLIPLRNTPWIEVKDQPGMYSNQVSDEWMEEFCKTRDVTWEEALIVGANAILDKMITGDDRKYEVSIHFSPVQKDLFHFQIQRHYYEGAPFSQAAYLRDNEQEWLRK